MLIKINGEESTIPENWSLQDLVSGRQLPEARLILELNGDIVKKEDWGIVKLSSRDELEMIQVIGGG